MELSRKQKGLDTMNGKTQSLVRLISFFCLFLFALSSVSANYYLDISIKGESTHKEYKGWIDVESYEIDEAQKTIMV